jgi:hypothetical protein
MVAARRRRFQDGRMSTISEAFSAHPVIESPVRARHLDRKRMARTAAHAAPRPSRLARILLDTSTEQEALLRENRERAWLELAGVVAGRYRQPRPMAWGPGQPGYPGHHRFGHVTPESSRHGECLPAGATTDLKHVQGGVRSTGSRRHRNRSRPLWRPNDPGRCIGLQARGMDVPTLGKGGKGFLPIGLRRSRRSCQRSKVRVT